MRYFFFMIGSFWQLNRKIIVKITSTKLYQEILNVALKFACLNAPLLSGGDQGLAYYYYVVL